MSSFYNIGSSAAKVVPERLSSPSHIVLITQINKKAMDSSTNPDLLIKPLDCHSKLLPPDDMIKPMILTFEKKIMLNQGSIAAHQSQEGTISCNVNPTGEDYGKKQAISSSAYQASASPEGELWAKLDSRPLSPLATKQVIRESAYLFPKQSEVNDLPPSPTIEKSEKIEVKEEPAYLLPKQIDRPLSPSSFKSEKIRDSAYQTELGNRPSSPSHINVIKPQIEVRREAAYQSPNEAELDACKSLSADDEGSEKPKIPVIREAAFHDKLSEMKESYRSSPAGRLSRVVEESESFSRREFGANVVNYMSTHSSANHAANLSNFSYKHPSYHHNSHSNFSYNHSSYQSGNFNSKSAPAGTAVRTGSAFALFRRGTSEGGNLGAGRRVYRRRKPRSLAHTLLWPLLKIRNGYVGCMMGLEGAGDLSGMAQGGTYATNTRYFADVPLSKTDSRNHG